MSDIHETLLELRDNLLEMDGSTGVTLANWPAAKEFVDQLDGILADDKEPVLATVDMSKQKDAEAVLENFADAVRNNTLGDYSITGAWVSLLIAMNYQMVQPRVVSPYGRYSRR